MVATANLESALADFGLDAFRPGQREVIQTVLNGRDALCVMPTGGGKSLCYQLPALCLDGVTLVVSPLIALMKDQEDQLRQRGVSVTAIHSGLELAEQRDRLDAVSRGEYSLVYVAPERFRSSRFVEMIKQTGVALLAVDEAHCISEWGHDFRPDYARLGWYRRQLDNPTTIALTATATDIVRRDIVDQLSLENPAVFIRGFDRPNLHYGVSKAATKAQKLVRLQELIEKIPGSIIVYTSSRKACEEVAQFIRNRTSRKGAVVYHAGLMPDERRDAQDVFMAGKIDIVVATNAFGMGVDKPDIRAVIHYNFPGTIEAYYQEAGRAGRDGEPACCELLFSPSDKIVQEYFIDNEYPARQTVFSVLQWLRAQNVEIVEKTRSEIKVLMGDSSISEMAIGSCLKILEHAGVVERLRARQNMATLRIHETGPDLTDLLPKSAKTQRLVLRHFEKMVGNRRGEDFLFHPDAVARTLGIERNSLVRALQEICEGRNIEYLPPFRGSATRVLDRDTPMSDLPIDFDQLGQRKQNEYDKLQHVLRYAQSHQCRRQAILGYFGEQIPPCGNCDVCNASPRDANPGDAGTVVDDGVREVLQTVLGGIAECKGRFGKHLIAQALTGSQAKQVMRFGLDKRQCFAKLQHFRKAEAVQLIEALLLCGLAQQEGDNLRPTVNISSTGLEVLHGEGTIPASFEVAGDLWRRLSVSPPPSTSAPPRKRDEPRDTPPQQNPPAARQETYDPTEGNETELSDDDVPRLPSYLWTWRLLEKGFDVGECAAIRGSSPDSILGHALAAAREGKPVPLAPFQEFPFTAGARRMVDQLADLVEGFGNG